MEKEIRAFVRSQPELEDAIYLGVYKGINIYRPIYGDNDIVVGRAPAIMEYKNVVSWVFPSDFMFDLIKNFLPETD